MSGSETRVEIETSKKHRLEQLATRFILFAELFGSGRRDATGSTTRSNFVVNRGGYKVQYDESSGSMYASGRLVVTDSTGSSVLDAVRDISTPNFEAGWPYPLSYKLMNYNPPTAENAYLTLCEDLSPIGSKGLQLPFMALDS